MRKLIFFERFEFDWPNPEELKPFFFAPPGKQWFDYGGNDSALISCQGLEGTEHLQVGRGRIDADLLMWGNPSLGVMLIYTRLGGDNPIGFTSKGDLARLREYTRTSHGDLRPIGLFIPFEQAWLAVKKFMETEGEFPDNIAWISNKDLPPDIYPDPHDPRFDHIE